MTVQVYFRLSENHEEIFLAGLFKDWVSIIWTNLLVPGVKAWICLNTIK